MGNLIDIVIQVYIEMLEIVNYFSWQSHGRPKLRGQTATRFTSRQPRLASIASSSQKRKSTIDAILGNNESQLQKKAKETSESNISHKGAKMRVKKWEDFCDDLIFLKHLDSIAYIDTDEITEKNSMILFSIL